MLVAATIALSLAPGLIQTGEPQAPASNDAVLTTYKMAGVDVAAKIPAPKPAALPGTSSVAWDGWTYAIGSKGSILGRIKATGGWDDVRALFAEAKSRFGDTTPQLRVKVVVFTRLDVLDVSASGVVRQRRTTLEPSMVAKAQESVARFCAVAEAYGGGRYRVVPEVQIENDTLHLGSAKVAFDEAFAQWYFAPRINGGGFEPEDKVFRGPYDSVLYIHPGTAGDGQPTAVVNGMPVTGIAYEPNDEGEPKRDLAEAELAAWLGHMARAVGRWEVPSDRLLAPTGIGNADFVDSPEWLLIGSVWGATGCRVSTSLDERLAALGRRGKPGTGVWSEAAGDPWRKLPWLKPAEIAAFTGKKDLVDAGKPGVFHDFVLTDDSGPGTASAETALDVALDSKIVAGAESLALLPHGQRALLFVPAGLAEFVGGRLKPALDARVIGATAWGTERYVVFDIVPDPAAKSEVELLDLSATPPTPHAAGPDRLDTVKWALHYAPPAQYAVPEGTAADAGSESPEARALAAAQLNDGSTPAQRAAVVGLLAAREDYVKLNAAQAFARVKEATAEAGLTELTNTYNTRLAELALRALAFQGTETAWATIRRVMNYGRYDYSRQVATELIGSLNDAKLSPVISVMLTSRSWQGRLSAAEAIGRQKDLGSQRILMAFLNEIDPAIRMTVVKLANTELDPIAHKLLWPAVNDASDLVRAWSYIGLVHSPKDENRVEGYKGVRDDSVIVRLAVLRDLQERPDAAHRGALRLAVTDSSPIVRAGALAAFAAMPGEVAAAEIQNVMGDKDPLVQAALVALAKAKSLKLPSETVVMLRSSVDPAVAAGAKELSE